MSTRKSLLYAAGITVISAVCLTITSGIPTAGNLLAGSAMMFVLAFIVIRLWGGSSN